MKLTSTIAILIVVAALVIVGFFYFQFTTKVSAPTTATSTPAVVLNSVSYSCDASKTIIAAYSSDSVSVTLSDHRTLTLPQVMSGSGIRYESTSTPGTDISFSSKGDNAFLQENDSVTYSNCVANATPNSGTASGMSTFTDGAKTFSFMYPTMYTVAAGGPGYTADWMVNSPADGLLLAKLQVPSSYMPKTNFVDATFTVGTSPNTTAITKCLTAPASGTPVQKSVVVIHGVTYSKFISSDAGAGNQYETTSYRTLRNNQCYAVEYTIHSSNIGNYSPDQGISEFDKAKVTSLLESITQSFMFLS